MAVLEIAESVEALVILLSLALATLLSRLVSATGSPLIYLGASGATESCTSMKSTALQCYQCDRITVL